MTTAFAFLLLLPVWISQVASKNARSDGQTPILVMVSVDGMLPDYVTRADELGARVPNLRRLMKEGSYAEGVQGDIPTVTYPSHTTLVTGVWPAKHGIPANTPFDPLRKNHDGWYWYAEDIHAPTLWDAAHKAGRTTASIQWPVTVGATQIDWNIPEIWRAGTPEDQKLVRALTTPGLMAEASAEIGPYAGGIETSPDADEVRGKYAAWILAHKRPALMTVHLLSLDHIEHETGPFSPEAIATLQRLDGTIENIRKAAEDASSGNAIFAVVSDHGFVRTDKQLNLFAAFRKARLLDVDGKGKITDWVAMPWPSGGSSAVVLKNPDDAKLIAKVSDLLKKLAANSENGIDRVLDAEELHKRGGYPTASFLVGLKPGWRTTRDLSGPVLKRVKPGGTHGELPDLPELRASFFAAGPGIPAGKDLGLIDMRDIAPALADAAGLSLPTAEGKDLFR